jgi:hypothetical protein
MRKLAKFISAAALAGLVITAYDNASALVSPRGTDTTFEALTWNVKDFPYSGFRTIDTLAILINDLDIDMIAFQEISDTVAFRGLLTRLPGWAGVYAPYDYNSGSYLKTAVIWRTDRATVNYIDQLFIGYSYQFPRPPIHVYVTVNYGGAQFDFHLISMHLKAMGDEESEQRRRAAIIMLKAYLDANVPAAPDHDWMVVGDWNDELDDPQGDNVFWPLLTDSLDYRFLTLPLAGNDYWASYPSWPSMLDHILIVSDSYTEYGNGTTITLRLDDEYPNYPNRISDHRPVMSIFAGNTTAVYDEPLPMQLGLSTVYPNPFNGSAIISFSLREAARVTIEIYDLLGRRVAQVTDRAFPAGRNNVTVDAAALGFNNSAVYFYRIEAGQYRSSGKMALLK